MCKISDELKVDGFSVHAADALIQRNNGSRSFKHLDYFQIHIILENTELIVENKTHLLSSGDLVYISPQKNVTFGLAYENKGSVYVVAFLSSFYERSLSDVMLLNSQLFFSCKSETFITSASIPIEEVKKLIIDRLFLYKEKNNKGLYIATAHNCIEALLLDGLLYVEDFIEEETEDMQKFVSIDIINRFRVLLQGHYKNERSVSFYAKQLYVTPRQLTKISKSIVGKTAKQMIVDKIVNEGIRMLTHSNYTISEISYELNFSDEGNFSAFIKKYTEKTPRELRKYIFESTEV